MLISLFWSFCRAYEKTKQQFCRQWHGTYVTFCDNYNVKVSKFSVAQYFSNRYCRSLINLLGFSWTSDQNSNATKLILFHHTDILKTYAWTFKSNPTDIPSVLTSSQSLRSFRLLGPENLNSLLGLNVAVWVVCPNNIFEFERATPRFCNKSWVQITVWYKT